MAKLYGDLPCAKLDHGIIHLTVSGTRCACGHPWHYGVSYSRTGAGFTNIIWRDKAAITCPKCLAYLEKSNQTH